MRGLFLSLPLAHLHLLILNDVFEASDYVNKDLIKRNLEFNDLNENFIKYL